MKKNAFTLVELLGVMLLLGLIALITAPVILNSIDESKKNTFSFAADSIIYLVDEYYEGKRAELGLTYQGEFLDISNDLTRKKLKFPDTDIKEGNIYIDSNGNVIMYVTNGSWCASKEKNNSQVFITKGNECVTNNSLKKEFVNLVEKDYHSFTVEITSPINQTFTKYEFSINNGTWINNGTNSSYSYTVSKAGLYVVKARVTNNLNEVIELEELSINVEKIKNPIFTTTPSGKTLSSQKEVSIENDDDFDIYYSLDGKNYSKYTSSIVFTESGSISAYVTDGVVNSNIVTYNILKIDSNGPVIDSVTQNDTSIVIKATDKGIGISAYCLNTQNDSSSCEWKESSKEKYEYNKETLAPGNYYVFVKDSFNNISLVEDVEVTS